MHAEDAHGRIISLLQQYQRPVTVLEMGNHVSANAFKRAACCRSSYIVMLHHQETTITDTIQQNNVKNMIILRPDTIDYALLDNLGKCEHFDVVVVRDAERQFDKNILYAIFKASMTLGDHLFIEMDEALVALAQSIHPCTITASDIPHKVWCYFEIYKKYLKKARWTLREESTDNYEIVSSFSEKKMYKRSTNTTSNWIAGINLVTFIMLKGLYPTDGMIREQLKKFKTLNHNDLVVGNIVVQGNQIRAIDFHDSRRNISPSICIKAAIKKLICKKRLQRDPLSMLKKYSAYLQLHKRKMWH